MSIDVSVCAPHLIYQTVYFCKKVYGRTIKQLRNKNIWIAIKWLLSGYQAGAICMW